ncbi:enoyl-CoA hydratase/isomerase family protein [Bacillus piscicola]|uniref:enoyl-CoA hydratase/isomerase family protein n=1 Tax=Bacillus piscicola TaxID=1632684 RepID=UPI001F08B3E2|nr:enoyl-CoA hydratase-related protein [Bacillus piscicola]
MSQEYETILYRKESGTATICLNRPEAFNAFTAQMNKDIIHSLRQAEKDDGVRSIMITGAGKAFCAGEDLGGVDEKTNHAAFLRKRYHPMLKALKNTSKPVTAAVNGTAAGAGMSLALACDFRLVKPDVKFVSAFTGIGLIPDTGFLYMLPRVIGYAKAMELAVLGKPLTGKEAFQLGLATEMIEPPEWEEKTVQFTDKLAAMPTTAVSLIKRYMIDSMHEPLDEFLEKEAQAQRIAGATADHKEGLAAFKEKRTAQFTGK